MTRRRAASFTSATRSAILDAAEEIMVNNGYAAVTSRSVAIAADLKSNLLHYYFETMDDLFIALYARLAAGFIAERKVLLDADKPMRRLWDIASDEKIVTIMSEFVSLSNHRKTIQNEISRVGDELREIDLKIVRGVLERKGLNWTSSTAVMVTVAIESIARSLARQRALGVSKGRVEAIEAYVRLIDMLESDQPIAFPNGDADAQPA